MTWAADKAVPIGNLNDHICGIIVSTVHYIKVQDMQFTVIGNTPGVYS